MEITTVGIDLAKNVFQICAMNRAGKVVQTKRLKRRELVPYIMNLNPCLIGVEACSTAFHWAREFQKHGHEVKLIAPQYVKPFVKTNKNDFNDAEAIAEAVQRPSMHFVPIKSVEQQNVQALHRVRSRLVGQRTALMNEIRGLLAEYGIAIDAGTSKLRTELPRLMEDGDENQIAPLMRAIVAKVYGELLDVDERIKSFDQMINEVFKQSEVCQRIAEVEGIGKLTATAIVAAVGDAKTFKSGRQMAAWLGLVPRQNSSGSKTRLLGISKRGDVYLRTLLIHGARSAVLRVAAKTDKRSEWIKAKLKTRGPNKTYVALANKNVRVIWKLMSSGEVYEVRAA